MKQLCMFLAAGAVALASAQAQTVVKEVPALAGMTRPTTDPWSGVWKIDTSQGHLVGDTFTYTKLPDGWWQVSSGGAVEFKFRADGTPYQTTDPANTVAVTRITDRAWTLSRRSGGKEWDSVREELSPDGDTLSSIDHEMLDDGSTNVVTTTYARSAPGKGFEGKWKSIRLSGPHINWIFPFGYEMKSTAGPLVSWEIPSYHLSLQGRNDGTPILLSPPGTSPATSVTITKTSERQLSTSILVDGQSIRNSKYTLASDGRSFSQASWDPAKPDEVRTAVFVKQ